MKIIQPVLVGALALGAGAFIYGCESDKQSGYYQYQQEKVRDSGRDYHARYGTEPPASDMPNTHPDTTAQPSGGLLPPPEPARPVVPQQQTLPPRQP